MAQIFPEPGRFTDGAMNYVAHLQLARHLFEVTGPCDLHAIDPNNYNNVSLVRDDMQGDYEVTCGESDVPSQKNLSPRSKFCNETFQTACPNMNYQPELATLDRLVETATALKLSDATTGRLLHVAVNISRRRRTSDATLQFGRRAGPGRHMKQVVLSTAPSGRETVKRRWYS